jgi:gluconate 5-dehydrogenase
MENPLFDVEGKVALITGSTRGLGFTLAAGLARAGANVVLNGRNEESLKKSVEELRKQGAHVQGYAFDVLDKERIKIQVERIENQVGPIDILVNNAGIQARGPLEQSDEQAWRSVIDTNLTGVFLTSQQVVRGMINRKSGKIINICSLQSEAARSGIGSYVASKGGVKMLTKSMASEWAKYNIQVNGIGPGYFITDLNKTLAADPAFDRWVKERTPAGRWGLPEELVGATIMLSSKASDFITGQVIYVDGGMLARL